VLDTSDGARRHSWPGSVRTAAVRVTPVGGRGQNRRTRKTSAEPARVGSTERAHAYRSSCGAEVFAGSGASETEDAEIEGKSFRSTSSGTTAVSPRNSVPSAHSGYPGTLRPAKRQKPRQRTGRAPAASAFWEAPSSGPMESEATGSKALAASDSASSLWFRRVFTGGYL